jgi:hypothetical protein
MNYRQIKDIEQKNKERILKVCDVPEISGIYILTRYEDGFKYAYVGQAKHLLTRLAQHLSGYQHIDLSLKKHGLYSTENPNGWHISWLPFHENVLDEYEQKIIKRYANDGFQLRNKTSGSQGEGKRGLGNQKASKGYYDGLQQGYKNAQKFVSNLFDKHLNYSKKSEKPNKNQEKALEKFESFLNWSEGE